MITLYGNDVSTPSNKVRFVANALGMEYQYQPVNLLGGDNKTENFLKLNPVGKVPVLVDGDFSLFESNAIIRYLADKEGSSLYPKDRRQRAKVDQWLDFASLHVGTALARVFVNRVAYQILNLEKDERSLQDGLNFLDRFLPVVESQLHEHSHFASSELTLADFGLLAHLDQADVAGIELTKYPHLQRWRTRLQAEPFYQKCYPSYAQMLQDLVAKRSGQ